MPKKNGLDGKEKSHWNIAYDVKENSLLLRITNIRKEQKYINIRKVQKYRKNILPNTAFSMKIVEYKKETAIAKIKLICTRCRRIQRSKNGFHGGTSTLRKRLQFTVGLHFKSTFPTIHLYPFKLFWSTYFDMHFVYTINLIDLSTHHLLHVYQSLYNEFYPTNSYDVVLQDANIIWPFHYAFEFIITLICDPIQMCRAVYYIYYHARWLLCLKTEKNVVFWRYDAVQWRKIYQTVHRKLAP